MNGMLIGSVELSDRMNQTNVTLYSAGGEVFFLQYGKNFSIKTAWIRNKHHSQQKVKTFSKFGEGNLKDKPHTERADYAHHW